MGRGANPDHHTYAMKIENLQEADSKDGNNKDANGNVKKQPVPMNQSQLLYE